MANNPNENQDVSNCPACREDFIPNDSTGGFHCKEQVLEEANRIHHDLTAQDNDLCEEMGNIIEYMEENLK